MQHHISPITQRHQQVSTWSCTKVCQKWNTPGMIILLSLDIAERHKKWLCGSHILFFSYLEVKPFCIGNSQTFFLMILIIINRQRKLALHAMRYHTMGQTKLTVLCDYMIMLSHFIVKKKPAHTFTVNSWGIPVDSWR